MTHRQVMRQYCTFRLGGRLFGVEIQSVREVNRRTEFTKVPHAPEGVVGHINVRGQVFLILDLARMFGLPHKSVDEKSRVVLFKPAVAELIGILVDEIGDIVETDAALEQRFEGAEHQRATSGNAIRTDVVLGVCQLPGDLLVVLDARRLASLLSGKTQVA